MSQHSEAKFTHGGLMRHVSVMSFTSSIGLMAIFAVDFIDIIFISMLGNAALAAAVGYAGTVLFFTTSMAIGFSIALGALVARALGEGNKQAAREYATSVLVMGIAISLITVFVVFMNMGSLLSLLGADEGTRALAVDFLTIIIPTMPILMAAIMAGAVLRAYGDAKRAMYATLAAGVVNAVLDPLLIFTLDMGLEGAATASAIARFVVLAVGMYPAIKRYDAFAPPAWSFIKRDTKRVFNIALPAVMTNVATPVGTAIVTREMARFGTDAVAGMAVISRLTPVAFAVVFALSGAIGPIIGQNSGAGLQARVRGAFIAGLQFVLVYVIVVSVVLFLLRNTIVTGFEATGDAEVLILLFCGPLALAFFFNGVLFVSNAAFNNLGHPFYSTMINWGRNTVGVLPFVLLGASWYGAAGVLLGQAIGGVVFAVVSYVLAWKLVNAEYTTGKKSQSFWQQARIHMLQSRHR